MKIIEKIKIKHKNPTDIKVIDKTITWTERIKDPIINTSRTINNPDDDNINDYGDEKIKYVTNRIKDETMHFICKETGDSTNIMKQGLKTKREKHSNTVKLKERKINLHPIKFNQFNNDIVYKDNQIKNKILKESKKIAEESTKKVKKTSKNISKAVASSVKHIINGLKSLIAFLFSGGIVSLITIVVICLVGLLSSSIFGIFFSSQKTNKNAITMNEVVAECNQEFNNKLQQIQNSNPHDEYILEGEMASWKDILILYTIKTTNGINEKEVLTIDNEKKQTIKNIFWDMNNISSYVNNENVIQQGVNIDETPQSLQEQVLHIKIDSKNINQMKNQYHLNFQQNLQLEELSSKKYVSLWNGVIYGIENSGDFVNWRQRDSKWSNIKIGNTSSNICDIGCLVTSIAILIEKSNCNNFITPFNPGIFVEELNKNNGFDYKGNLQYAAINKVIPNFKYAGNINLRGKTKEEKFKSIKQYFDKGYYITIEVKGATPGNQHWVALNDIYNNELIMVDPGTNHTNLWNSYEYIKTSQFNYFKIE